MKHRKTWFRPVLCFFNSLVFILNSLEFDILEDPVTQIPLFLTRNCYGGVSYLELSTSSSSFVIEFSDDLVGDLVYWGASIERSWFQSCQLRVFLTRIVYQEFSIPESSTKSHFNQDHLSKVLNSRVVNQELP